MSEKIIDKIFIEYGLDFENNKFGLGKSIEIEYKDGSEERVKTLPCLLSDKNYYFRFWILKTVFMFLSSGLEVVKKNRNNFKIIWGVGYNPQP